MIKTSMPTDTRETLTVLTVDRIVGGERHEPPLSCRNGEIRKGIKEKERKREREKKEQLLPLCIWREEASLIDPISRHDSRCCHVPFSQGNFEVNR